MKKSIKTLAALSVFAAAAVGTSQSAFATVKISDNPSSPQSFQICDTVENAFTPISASFDHDTGAKRPDASSDFIHYNPSHPDIGMEVYWNTFSNVTPDASHIARQCRTVDASDFYFDDDAAPGLYSIGVIAFGVYSQEDEMSTPLWAYDRDANDPRPMYDAQFEYIDENEMANHEYNVYFELSNKVNNNNEIIGKEARLAYIIDGATNEKVEQIDFHYKKLYPNQDITISKTVKGNAADNNKFFTFRVNISGEQGAIYTVYGASANSGSATSCTANTDCIIKIKSGETIRIGFDGTNKQIPVGSTYTITEVDADDYTTSVSVGSGSATNTKTTGQRTITPEGNDNVTTFVDVLSSSVATGVFNDIWPFILLGFLSITAIAFSAKKTCASKKA